MFTINWEAGHLNFKLNLSLICYISLLAKEKIEFDLERFAFSLVSYVTS